MTHLIPTKDGNVYQLESYQIHVNDLALPGLYNPHKVKMFIVGNEYGPLCALWASESELFDTLIDLGCGEAFVVSEEDLEDYRLEDGSYDVSYCGNDSSPCDLSNAWYEEVDFDSLDVDTKYQIARAWIAGDETLGS